MNPGRPPGPGQVMAVQARKLIEHDIHVFTLKPDRYEKDAAEMKTWMDGVSYRGGEIANLTTRIHDDGTVTIMVIGARQELSKVATAVPIAAPRG